MGLTEQRTLKEKHRRRADGADKAKLERRDQRGHKALKEIERL